MNEIINSSEKLEIATEPEAAEEIVPAEETETVQEPAPADELIPAEEPDKNTNYEKKIKRRATAAKILGITALSITALKVLLCPILAIATLILDVLVFVFLMMGGALVLAMTALAAPYVLPIAIVVVLLAIALIILIELTPIILGIVSVILASSAKKTLKAHAVDRPECQKATAGAKKLSLIGLIVSIAAEPIAGIPTLLLFLPLLLLMVLAAVWLIQLIGLALA